MSELDVEDGGGRRTKILLVTPTVPYPPNWGFGIRVFNFIRELSKTCDVTVVCYAEEADRPKVDELRTYCTAVHTVASPLSTTWRKRAAQLRSVVSHRSFQSLGLRSKPMEALFRRLLSRGSFDLVQLESSQLSAVADWGATPLIVDEHNIEYELLHRMFEVETSPLRKGYNWLEYRKFKTEEFAAWRGADACVLTSRREQVVVAARERSKLTHVAPNGVDIDFFVPSDGPPTPESIVYTGLMSYRPNVDAVTFFVEEVLPLIVAKRPTAQFTIVGLRAHESVGSLAGPNVRILSDVPDVRPYVREAAVFAVPLRMGSGTRLKILEGLAMGKAIVSTRLGCEGIEVVEGEHLLVADEPAEFADAVLRLMVDRELSERLGRTGRTLVEERYSWVTITAALAAFQQTVIAAKRR